MTSVLSNNPYRPSEVVGEYAECAVEDLPEVLKRAEAGRREWNALAATERSRALNAAADALKDARGRIEDLVVREVGKPVTEARGEVQRGIDILRYHAASILMPEGEVLAGSTATGLQFTRRRPLGTVAVVTPWNFPVAIPLWKAAPALAWGNAVLLKPSSAGVAVAHALAELITPHVPDGLLQCLPGGGALVRRLVEVVQGLSFTGSTAVGRQLIRQCAEHAIPCQAEMGGSNPSVVLADADLDRASAAIAASAMAFAGQKCTATSRIIVEASIYESFRDRIIDQVGALHVGDPADEPTVSGPVIDQRALDDALAAIEDSTGRILAGGTATGTGYTLRPTLVEVGGSDILLEDEVFAPVAALCRVEGAEEAFRAAAATRFGLSAGIFTNDLDRALRYIDFAEAGMVRVNAPTTGVDYWAPFGGMKSSSYGTREQGLSARDFYTHGCTIFVER